MKIPDLHLPTTDPSFIKDLGWNITKDIDHSVTNFEEHLLENHKIFSQLLKKLIICIKIKLY